MLVNSLKPAGRALTEKTVRTWSSIRQSINLSHQSINPGSSIRQSINPSIHQSVNPSIRSIRQSVNPGVINPAAQRPSIHQSVNPSIRGSSIQPLRGHQSVNPSIRQSEELAAGVPNVFELDEHRRHVGPVSLHHSSLSMAIEAVRRHATALFELAPPTYCAMRWTLCWRPTAGCACYASCTTSPPPRRP